MGGLEMEFLTTWRGLKLQGPLMCEVLGVFEF